MSAEIWKIGNHDTDPALLLRMVASNLPKIESVVISVVVDGVQHTYRSSMKNSEMAWHMYCVTQSLTKQIEAS